MSKRINGLAVAYLSLSLPPVAVFWLLYVALYGALLVSWILRAGIQSGDSVLIGGVAGIGVFLLYMGCSAVGKFFVFSVNLSATRWEALLALIFYLTLFVSAMTVVQTFLYLLIEKSIIAPNYNVFYFSFKGADSFSLAEVGLFHLGVNAFASAVGFAMGCCRFRWGTWVLYLATALLLIGSYHLGIEGWIDLFMIDRYPSLVPSMVKLLLAAVVAVGVGWLAMFWVPIGES